MSSIESEFRQAFKRAGYGDVVVRIDKMGVSSGYGIESEMSFLIRITKIDLLSETSSNPYTIIKRRKSKKKRESDTQK